MASHYEEIMRLQDELDGGAVPLFGRMGGKSKLSKRIIALIPDDYKTFVEPFVGAGNIFFKVEQEEGKKYVINDKDSSVIKIYRGVKKHPEAFVISSPTREEFKHILKKSNKTDVEEYTLLKMSFFSKGTSWIDKPVTNPERQLKKLQEVSKLLSNATILNENFATVIRHYDSPSTFFYLDPPYESTEQKDYKDYVTPEEVYDAVKSIKGRFLLSYNKSAKIIDVFKKFKIREIQTAYNSTGTVDRRPITEVLISNY